MTTSRPEASSKEQADAAGGFPLSALFLLTALCCVLAALAMQYVRSALAGELHWEILLVASVVGAVQGMILGSLLGLAQRGPVTGMFVGGPTGFVLGAIVAPLCLVPVEQLSGIMGVTIGGSALLIVVAVVIRMVSGVKGSENTEHLP